MIADFMLQTRYQVSHKMSYGHPGGLLHAGIHAVLTLPVYLIIPADPHVMLAIASCEFVIHYHVDYLKERLVLLNNWSAVDAPFWWAFGTDQLLHNLTYLGIVAFLLR
jgi:hypothetical protein